MIEFWYLLFIILLVVLLQYHWKKRRLYKLSWSLNGPFSLPIVGDAWQLLCKNEDILDRVTNTILANKPSPIKFWFGPKLTVVFTSADHIEKVMSSMKFIQKDKVYRFMKPFHGDSLISGSGAKWKTDRRLLSPLFMDRKVKQYFEIMVQQSDNLAKMFKTKVNQETFDVELYLHRCACDIVTESFLGIKPKAQAGHMDKILDTISRMYILVHSRIAKIWLQNEFIFNLLGYGKIQQEGRSIIHGFLYECIDAAKAKHNNNNDKESYQTIVDQMLFIRDEFPEFSTDQELVEHFTTLYTASEDTITIICSFALVVLGMSPTIQNKIAKELLEVFGPVPRSVEFDDLSKLTYLLMCIKDIMRLFPIAPFIMREATEDCEIDLWTIPKGCSVLVSIYNIHRSPLHWEHPNEFYPEHFLPEKVKERHPYCYMPFSAGPRGCIGKPYAYMAIKVLLATILQHYQIEADGTLQEKKIKSDITVRFKDGDYPIRLKRRIYQR